MPILKVTAKGQVTLKREVLAHMGIHPGDRIEIDLLPGGKGIVRAAKSTETLQDWYGCLRNKTGVRASLDDIDKAIADAWAGGGL